MVGEACARACVCGCVWVDVDIGGRFVYSSLTELSIVYCTLYL